jgi:hypothetical protein
MRSRTKALTQLGNLIPAIIVTVAVVVSLEPRPLGIEIPDRAVVLALLAFLGADAIVERSGRLYSMDQKLDAIRRDVAGPTAASKVLRTRASFDRMEVLLAQASRSITIIGINLEGAIIGLGQILELARAGGTVQLLAMDPDGACIPPTAAMSGVDPAVRREKIRQNLTLLRNPFAARLTGPARRRVTLAVADKVFPVSIIALDAESQRGSLIVQHHLVAVSAEQAPMVLLSKQSDQAWFDRYLEQSRACFSGAREWC